MVEAALIIHHWDAPRFLFLQYIRRDVECVPDLHGAGRRRALASFTTANKDATSFVQVLVVNVANVVEQEHASLSGH